MPASFAASLLGRTPSHFLAASLIALAGAGTLSACLSGAGDLSEAADGRDATAPIDAADARATADADVDADAAKADGATDAAPDAPADDGASGDASRESGPADTGSDDAAKGDATSGDAAEGDATTEDAAVDAAADVHPSGPIDITGGSSCTGVLDVTAALTSGVQYHVTAPGLATGHDPGWDCNAAVSDGSKTYLSFRAPHAGNYVIRVTGGDESQWHNSAMYARRTCAQLDANTQLACNTNAGFDSTFVGVDSAQTVYLVADGAYFLGDPIAGTSGFDLTIAAYTACQSATDCANFDGQPDCDVAGGDCFRPLVCPTGEASCDPSKPNACNFNVTSDRNNCGACGTACTAPSGGTVACVSSSCVATCSTGGDVACGNACVNLASNVENCGKCGNWCGAPTNGSVACVSSACVTSCNPGFIACGFPCADPKTDPANCGGCGASCNGGGCNAGKCGPALPTPAFAISPDALSLDGWVADSAALYAMGRTLVADEQVIYRYALADGTQTMVADLGAYNEFSAASIVTGPFSANTTTLFYFTGPDTFANVLWAVPKTGGTPTQLDQSRVTGPFAVDDNDAYWDGLHVPLNGAPATTFTSSLWTAVGLDATYVYWIGGSDYGLYRMARTATVDAPEEILPGPLSTTEPTLTVTPNGILMQNSAGVYLAPLARQDGGAAVLLRANDWAYLGPVAATPSASATNAYFLLGPALWQAPFAGGPAVELAALSGYNSFAYVPSVGVVFLAPASTTTPVYVLPEP